MTTENDFTDNGDREFCSNCAFSNSSEEVELINCTLHVVVVEADFCCDCWEKAG